MNPDFNQDKETRCERREVSVTCTNIICNLRQLVLHVLIILRTENQRRSQTTGYKKVSQRVCLWQSRVWS